MIASPFLAQNFSATLKVNVCVSLSTARPRYDEGHTQNGNPAHTQKKP